MKNIKEWPVKILLYEENCKFVQEPCKGHHRKAQGTTASAVGYFEACMSRSRQRVGRAQNICPWNAPASALIAEKMPWCPFKKQNIHAWLATCSWLPSWRQRRRSPPCPLVIALVPLNRSGRNLQCPHRVPFTKEKTLGALALSKNKAYMPG